MLILLARVICAISRCTRWLIESDWFSHGQFAVELADLAPLVKPAPRAAGAALAGASATAGARATASKMAAAAIPGKCHLRRLLVRAERDMPRPPLPTVNDGPRQPRRGRGRTARCRTAQSNPCPGRLPMG